ncbi:unnamed protein product (macronuclear) [Paramecium tetraurelia]|uniref:Uncharacterized protein n=1 Tax=Paramecium tetraurelia TaxID=5888 RepID=A0CCR1_PARTE|nr:uncharacterized protein GSPATT00037363001 [Paramecium tetraurelia]CAK68578.1 unnamed protein product [Paramecium tetraurelia]|eukprot:XP_001435975.1 hypothetical protein (macronuclear) [Paramecium tetraurelia strain d4-2]
MSLLSRFTSIFSSSQTTQASSTPINQQLQEILTQIINSNGKLDLKQKGQVLAQFLLDRDVGEHIEFLFQFLETRSKDLSGVQVVNLLAAIHQQFQYNELIQEVAIKLRETKMSWVQLEKQEWYSTQTEPDQQKNQQTQKILTEFEDKAQPARIYAQLCYVYLQKLAANVDLYRSVIKLNYPYITEKDYIEAKLIFLWHYKIQNLINSGSILIQFNPNLIDIQVALYFDVWRFQKFICTEIEKIIDQYATLPNSDTLSLYEIYCESQRHYEHLNQFHQFTQSITQPPPQCQINNTLLQEFFAFVTKLKVLNQFNFKKSIKVPNKQDPMMGIPTKNPNVLNIRRSSQQLDDQQSNGSEKEEEDFANNKKFRSDHNRVQSTFQYAQK